MTWSIKLCYTPMHLYIRRGAYQASQEPLIKLILRYPRGMAKYCFDVNILNQIGVI